MSPPGRTVGLRAGDEASLLIWFGMLAVPRVKFVMARKTTKKSGFS